MLIKILVSCLLPYLVLNYYGCNVINCDFCYSYDSQSCQSCSYNYIKVLDAFNNYKCRYYYTNTYMATTATTSLPTGAIIGIFFGTFFTFVGLVVTFLCYFHRNGCCNIDCRCPRC